MNLIAIIILLLTPALHAQEDAHSQILSFQFEEKLTPKKEIQECHILTNMELRKGTKACNGDTQAFLKKYLLDLFLTVELQKHEKDHRVSSETILHFLIKEKMRESGYARDDFSPAVICDFYHRRKEIFESFFKQHNQGVIQKLEILFREYPEMRFLIVPSAVKLQSLWFTFPSVQFYKKREPHEVQKIEQQVQFFYDEIFSTMRVQQKAEIPPVTFVLSRARDVLKEKTFEHYTPMEALSLALEVSMGQYFVKEKEKFSADERKKTQENMRRISESFLSYAKELLYSVMEKRREQTTTLYQRLIKGEEGVSKKVQSFQAIGEELSSQHPSEIIYLKPEWISVGDTRLPLEIQEASFGFQRRKPGTIEPYEEVEGPHVAMALFQWMDYREMHFLDFKEERDGKWVGKWIQDFLLESAFARCKTQVERELFLRYRDNIKFYGVPGESLNLEKLFP